MEAKPLTDEEIKLLKEWFNRPAHVSHGMLTDESIERLFATIAARDAEIDYLNRVIAKMGMMHGDRNGRTNPRTGRKGDIK